jgi:hypothetical protein
MWNAGMYWLNGYFKRFAARRAQKLHQLFAIEIQGGVQCFQTLFPGTIL